MDKVTGMEPGFLLRPLWEMSQRERKRASGMSQDWDGGHQGEVTGLRERTVRMASSKAIVRAVLPEHSLSSFSGTSLWCHSAAAADVTSPWELHLFISQGDWCLTEEPRATPDSKKGHRVLESKGHRPRGGWRSSVLRNFEQQWILMNKRLGMRPRR